MKQYTAIMQMHSMGVQVSGDISSDSGTYEETYWIKAHIKP